MANKPIAVLINHCCSICGTHMDTLCEHLRYTPTLAQEIRDMAVIHKSQLEKPEPDDAGKPPLDNVVPQDVWDALGKGVVATTKKFFPFKKPLSESTRLPKSGPTLFGNVCAVCATPISVGCIHLSAKVTVEEKYDISYVWEPAEPCPSGTNGVGYYSGIHGVSGTVQPKSKFDFTPRVGSPCPYCAKGRYHAGEYCMDTGVALGIAWTPCKTCKDDPFHLDGICGSTGSPGCSGEGISGVLGSPIYTGDDGCQGAMGIPGHYMDNITTCKFCKAIMTKGTICCNSTHEKGKRFRDVCWCGDPHLDGSACGNPGPIGPAVFIYACNMDCPSTNCESYCVHKSAIPPGNDCPAGPPGTQGEPGIVFLAPCYIHGDKSKMPHGLCLCAVGGGTATVCSFCGKLILKGEVCCGSVHDDWIPREPLDGVPGEVGLEGCGGHELGIQIQDSPDYKAGSIKCEFCKEYHKVGILCNHKMERGLCRVCGTDILHPCKHLSITDPCDGGPGKYYEYKYRRFDTPGRKWLPPAKRRIMCGTSLVMAGPNALAHRQERRESTHPPLKKETNDFIHPRTAAYIKAHPKLLVDDMEEPP